jgi:hypothetical protein
MIKLTELMTELSVGDRTIRRWCAMFEETGYPFQKDDNNKRLFGLRELDMLKDFKTKLESMRMDEALKAVLPSYLAAEDVGQVKGSPDKECEKNSVKPNTTIDRFNSTQAILNEFGDLLKGDWLKTIMFYHSPERTRSEIYDKWVEVRAKVEQTFEIRDR